MAVEAANYISELDQTRPQGSDLISEGDNHITLVKKVVKQSFPNVSGAVSATNVQLSYVTGVTSAIQTQIDSRVAKSDPSSSIYGVDTGAENALVATVGSIAALTDGMTIVVKAANANSGAASINVNGLGAKSIVRFDGTDLQQNDIRAGQAIQLTYNNTGSVFQVLGAGTSNPISSAGTLTGATLAANVLASSLKSVGKLEGLRVARGSFDSGTAAFEGSVNSSNFNYSADEHTYLRGGKAASDLILNDTGRQVLVGATTADGVSKLQVGGNGKFEGSIVVASGTATAAAGAVTLDKMAGVITSEALTTAAGADYTLTLTNNKVISASSVVQVSLFNGTNTIGPIYPRLVTPAAGSVTIVIRNDSAAALNGTIKVSYVVFGA